MSACLVLSRSLRSAPSSAGALRQLLPSQRRPSPALILAGSSRPLSSSPAHALAWDDIPSRSELAEAQRPAPDRAGPKSSATKGALAAEAAEWATGGPPSAMTATPKWRLKKFEQQQRKNEGPRDNYDMDARPSRSAGDDARPPAYRGRFGDADRPRYQSGGYVDDRSSYTRGDDRAPRRSSFVDDDRSSFRQQDRPAYAPRDRDDRSRPADREEYEAAPRYRDGRSSDRVERPAYARDRDERPSYSRERESRPAYASERDARPSYSRERDDRPTYAQDRDDRSAYSRERDDTGRPSYRADRPPYSPRDRDERPAYSSRDREYQPSHARERPLGPPKYDARFPSDQQPFARRTKAGSAYPRSETHEAPSVRTQWDRMTAEEKEAHLTAEERKAELKKSIKADKAEGKPVDPELKKQIVQAQLQLVGISPEQEAEELTRTLLITKVSKHFSVKHLAENLAFNLPFLTANTPFAVSSVTRLPRKRKASAAAADKALADAPSVSASEDAPAESTSDAPAESTTDASRPTTTDALVSDDISAVPAEGEEPESTPASIETATPAPSEASPEAVVPASPEAPTEAEGAEPAPASSSEVATEEPASETPAPSAEPALEPPASALSETPSPGLEAIPPPQSEPAPAAEQPTTTPTPSPPVTDVSLDESSLVSSDVVAVDSPVPPLPSSPEADANAVASTAAAPSVPGQVRLPYLPPSAMIYSFPTLKDRELAPLETPIFQVYLPRSQMKYKGFDKYGPVARTWASKEEQRRKGPTLLPNLNINNMGWAYVRFPSAEVAQRALKQLTALKLKKNKNNMMPKVGKVSFSAALTYAQWAADSVTKAALRTTAAAAADDTAKPAFKPSVASKFDGDDDLRDADDGRPIRLSKAKTWVPVERARAKVYPRKPKASADGGARPWSSGGPGHSYKGGKKSFGAPAGRGGGDAPRSQSRSTFGLRD